MALIIFSMTYISSAYADEDPCAQEWENYQYELVASGWNFRDPAVMAAIRALRLCRLANA